MGNYLWLFICVDDYLSLFVIIDVFGVKGRFCDYLWFFICVKRSFFVKDIFIISTSMDKWASWLKTIKRKIQDFMIWKFYGIKNLKY